VKTILFACVHNAGRSQMAAALFNLRADPAQARAISAGTQPAQQVHPLVAVALAELGVPATGLVPRLLTAELARGATLLVTMGCGEACPHVPGLRTEDWPIRDPKGLPIDEVRRIRDEVLARVDALIARERIAR